MKFQKHLNRVAFGNKRPRQSKVILRQVVLLGVAFLVDGHVFRLVWPEFFRKFSSNVLVTDLRLLRQVPNGLQAGHLFFLVQLLVDPWGSGRVDWKGPTLLC